MSPIIAFFSFTIDPFLFGTFFCKNLFTIGTIEFISDAFKTI